MGNFKSGLVACGVLLALSGCQTMDSPGGPTPAQIVQNDPTTACMNRLHTAPFVAEQLTPKIGFGGNAAPTLQMLADKARPNDEQKEALSRYSAERDKCVASGTAYRQANMPGQVLSTLERNTRSVSILLAKLYGGDLTFGEFNTARSEGLMNMRAQLDEGDRQRQQARLEDDRRSQERLGNALQNVGNQMMMNNAYQPRTTNTNCQRFGTQVNCTTY